MSFKIRRKNIKALALTAFLVSGAALANDWDNPRARFSTKNNFTDTSTIQWITADDVQAACEKESRSRGYGGFNISVLACSFFKGNQCTIITGKNTTMHTLGHEVRHCFQADWHK